MTSCSGNKAVFVPGGQTSSKIYTITVTTTVRDLSGDAMAANYLSSYSVADVSSACKDQDLDGYGYPGNIACPKGAASDCNDYVASINPGASDNTCNGIDENCNGIADDKYIPTNTTCGTGACVTTGQNVCRYGMIVNTCTPVTEGPVSNLMCSDGKDNDCDGKIDSADSGCLAQLTRSVTLTWLKPAANTNGTQLTDLDGYRIYYGQTSRNYTSVMDINKTTSYTVSSLSQGTWCFAVTAYDIAGNESGYSNEVCKIVN